MAFTSYSASLAVISFVKFGTALASIPVITEHPTDVRVHRGAPATLNCGAFGAPAPTISWYKDGSRVLTGGGDHTVLLPGGNLFFLRTLHNHRSKVINALINYLINCFLLQLTHNICEHYFFSFTN